MRIETIKPRIVDGEGYALGVRTGGPVMLIQTYHSLEQLETGYKDWRELAQSRNLVLPIPLERVEGGRWKVLADIVRNYPSKQS